MRAQLWLARDGHRGGLTAAMGQKKNGQGMEKMGWTSETSKQRRNLAEERKAARRNERIISYRGWEENDALGGDATDATGGSNGRRLVGLRGGPTG